MMSRNMNETGNMLVPNDVQKLYICSDVGYTAKEELIADGGLDRSSWLKFFHLPPDTDGLPAEFASCDVSFISLKQIIPLLPALLTDSAQAVLLVKPQFEAGRQALNKNGIVRDEKIRQHVLRDIRDFAALHGFIPLHDCPSPIQGGSGNTEYLLHLQLRQAPDEAHL